MKTLMAALTTLYLAMSPGAAADFKIGNWNIQTLTYSGDPHTVFPDDYVRTPNDLSDLRKWRDQVGADVYFLQEVTSPAAIDEIFPVSAGWQHCISGQYAKDQENGVGPTCTQTGETAARPTGNSRAQYTAVAWRSQAGLSVRPVVDYEALNVRSVDSLGTIRDVRWGLDVTISAGTTTLRALVVHMKSGCFDDRINFRLFSVDPSTTAPVKDACDTVGRQMFPLHAWIAARQAAGDAWMVVGDFNRRLDAGAGRNQDEVWQALTAFSPGFNGVDRDGRQDIAIYRAPYKTPSACWADTSNSLPATLADSDDYNMLPIEFFLFGNNARNELDPSSEHQITWLPSTPADRKRLSDHCPSVMTGGASK